MSISHLLNRVLQVWRPVATPDGYGGQDVTYVRQPDDVPAKVDQPSADDRMLAQQVRAQLTHSIYLEPDADVRRGDELRDSGEVWEVTFVVEPSAPVYRKALTERVQSEGETSG